MSKSKKKPVPDTHRHPYSSPAFDYKGPWNTEEERDAAVEQAKEILTLTIAESQAYINNSMRTAEVLARLEVIASKIEARAEPQTKVYSILIVYTLVVMLIGAIIGYWVVL